MNITSDYTEEVINNLDKARNHFWYIHRNRIIDDLISKFNKEKPRILELGSGSGNVADYLSKKGYAIVASDFYQSGVELIKGIGIKVFQYDMVNNSRVPEENLKAYDIVILGDVIEHFNDPVQSLKNVKKFLVGRGGILITVPALSILWTRYDIFCRHKRRYSRKQLIEHLQLAGFSQIKVRYFMFLPGLILLVKRKINDLLGQNEAADLSVNPVINSVMKIFMLMEYWLQKLIYIPFGSSIYGIALVKDENRIL